MSVRAWSFLVVSGQRQYAGNDGYADDLARLYRFDSNVGNARQVAAGHLAVVRDTDGLLGVGVISEVRSFRGTKQLARCPVCGITALKRRASRIPAYRCNVGHEFDVPRTETIEVTKYEASYTAAWVPLAGVMDAHTLRSVTRGAGRMNSIQEVDISGFAARLAQARPDAQPMLSSFLQACAPDTIDDDDGDDGYVPSFGDRRMTILRAIRARRGQARFRKDLIDRHGPRCMITGCDLMAIIDAAHIWPYRGEEDNAISNGLLLRTDLHTLFDLDLLGIAPDTLKIHLASQLNATSYGALAGSVLKHGRTAPRREALNLRWTEFIAKQAAADGYLPGAELKEIQ